MKLPWRARVKNLIHSVWKRKNRSLDFWPPMIKNIMRYKLIDRVCGCNCISSSVVRQNNFYGRTQEGLEFRSLLKRIRFARPGLWFSGSATPKTFVKDEKVSFPKKYVNSATQSLITLRSSKIAIDCDRNEW